MYSIGSAVSLARDMQNRCNNNILSGQGFDDYF